MPNKENRIFGLKIELMSQVLDKKLHSAIKKLNDDQKKRVLFFVGQIADEEKDYDKWEDEGFVAEMERRYESYRNGARTYTQDEVDKELQQTIAKRKK